MTKTQNRASGMSLIIAEKPSVARAIAETVGASDKRDGYLEGGGYAVSWCFGHLIAMQMPEAYDPRLKTWRYSDLPIIPEDWRYRVQPGTERQFETLKALLLDKRFSCVVCATDAGREGELIFRHVYEQSGSALPVKRLWISSLEPDAILAGLKAMKDDSAYDSLYRAAVCRERADWLVGLNATRLFTLLYGRTLRVGRVMSPTLAMIAARENDIRGFRPETFYVVRLENAYGAESDRISDKSCAERVRDECSGHTATVTVCETSEKTEPPPRLYDLTALQRDANRLFGYTAQQTLDYAQTLYEKQLITYPRTDSRFITEDTSGTVPALIRSSRTAFPFLSGPETDPDIGRIVNSAKVTDHHAILPTVVTGARVSRATEGEKNILALVCTRLMCAMSEPYTYNDISLQIECSGHVFRAKARSTVRMGWKTVWNMFRSGSGAVKDDDTAAQDLSAPVREGDRVCPVKAVIRTGTTTPAERYTDGSILSAMETAGSRDMPPDAERRGIGTPATRAGILEKLISGGLIERSGRGRTKHLIPTDKGLALSYVLPEALKSPLLTADWEQLLKDIEHGRADAQAFMTGIQDMLRTLVKTVKRVPDASALFPPETETLGRCPDCGAAVTEKPRGFFCENRACGFGVWKDNRFLTNAGIQPTPAMVKRLLADRRVPLTGLKTLSGKPYSAVLVLDRDMNGRSRVRAVMGEKTPGKHTDRRNGK